jgi:hypothetical protein
VQDEQELPGQCTRHNEIINSVGEATDGNDEPSKDPDHTIDAENTIMPDRTLDSMEINIVGEANESNGHPSQESDVTVDAENSNVDEPDILFMTGPNQLTQLLSRQNQLLMMILIIMMYPEKNYQFNAFMQVKKSIQLIRLLM